MDKAQPTAKSLTNHPLLARLGKKNAEGLSPLENLCKKIGDWTGAPAALVAAVVIQTVWIIFGSISHMDPYPFAFLLTVSNVLQLILIFVLAVGQRQSASHDEARAEIDHAWISRLLYHQEAQEQILLGLAAKIEVDIGDVKEMVARLATDDHLPGT